MKKTEGIQPLRRQFLASAPFLFLGAASLKASVLLQQAPPRGADLSEILSPEEKEIVNGSAMAVDMDNYLHKGYGCAETGLMVALRFMKKPEDLVWAAAGFGGGLGHQDLCGFLTSGFMAIGLQSGSLGLDPKEAKARCSRITKEYWNWWASTAPLHCREIRENRQGFGVCDRLGKLASAKLETLLKA